MIADAPNWVAILARVGQCLSGGERVEVDRRGLLFDFRLRVGEDVFGVRHLVDWMELANVRNGPQAEALIQRTLDTVRRRLQARAWGEAKR